ncbi:hypothetical protein ACJMK2_044776 [Sinanodonta woodiana]|uniref:SET domain-containing protein n=1 Tax=Sinanodonta woodiana TaxID=1069815 RepID=A0ABD3T2R6_SINWO
MCVCVCVCSSVTVYDLTFQLLPWRNGENKSAGRWTRHPKSVSSPAALKTTPPAKTTTVNMTTSPSGSTASPPAAKKIKTYASVASSPAMEILPPLPVSPSLIALPLGNLSHSPVSIKKQDKLKKFCLTQMQRKKVAPIQSHRAGKASRSMQKKCEVLKISSHTTCDAEMLPLRSTVVELAELTPTTLNVGSPLEVSVVSEIPDMVTSPFPKAKDATKEVEPILMVGEATKEAEPPIMVSKNANIQSSLKAAVSDKRKYNKSKPVRPTIFSNTSSYTSRSGVCPICFKPVERLQRHLHRTCLPKVYSQSQSIRFLAMEQDRHKIWRNSVTIESNLLRDCVAGPNNEPCLTLDYVLRHIESVGGLVCRDLPSTFCKQINRSISVAPSSLDKPVAKPQSSPIAGPSGVAAANTVPLSGSPVAGPSRVAAANTVSLSGSPVAGPSRVAAANTVPLSGSPVAGPSGASHDRRMSDARRQLFDDDNEESLSLQMTFMEATEDVMDPVVSVLANQTSKKRTSPSSDEDDVPLSSVKKSLQSQSLANPDHQQVETLKLEDCPTLMQYKEHLKVILEPKQKFYVNNLVSNMYKILNFLDPVKENLDIIVDRNKVELFFKQLPQELVISSKLNYLKSFLRFLTFCEETEDIASKHPSLISHLPTVRMTLASIRFEIRRTSKKRSDKSHETKVAKTKKTSKSDSSSYLDLYYKIVARTFKISVDDKLPLVSQIQEILCKTNTAVKLDKSDLTKIRDRFKYQRIMLRIAHTITCFPRSRPSEAQIDSFLKEKGWTQKRILNDVLKRWQPSDRRCATTQRQTNLENEWTECIKQQKWTKIIVRRADDPSMGNGVFAREPIAKGEVVCDYHGDLVSHAEGLERYHTYPENINHFMMFFELGGIKYCIDSNTDCKCHNASSKKTKGRLVNHSKTNPNVVCKPILLDGVPRVLLHAKVDIPLGTELKYDYGVAKDKLSREDGANEFLTM